MKSFFNNKEIRLYNSKSIYDREYFYIRPKHPYISCGYVEPLIYEGESNHISMYITDDIDTLYKKGYYDEKFTLQYKIDNGTKKIISNIQAGQFTLDLPVLPLGEHTVELYVIDSNGDKSHELLHRFKVISRITDYETWFVTDDDLLRYSINKDGNDNSAIMTNTRNGLQNLFDYAHEQGFRKVILPTGEYRISNDHLDWDGQTPSIHPSSLVIPNNFTLDLNNSTIVQNGFVSQRGMMFTFLDTDDSHIINGTIQGDYATRDLTPTPEVPQYVGEFCGIISMQGECKYTSIENVTIKDSVGYACGIGINGANSVYGSVKYLADFKLVDINDDGLETSSEVVCTSGYADISTLVPHQFIMIGRFLGFRGISGRSSMGKIHFYDSNYNFIETKITQQYRKVRIPNGARYMRASIYQSTVDGINLCCYNMKSPYNCAFRDVAFENNRTCAIAFTTMNNCLMENVTFYDSGQSLTPAAIDLEDGWQQQQDFTIRNCEVLKAAGTVDLIVCAGYNIRMEDCKNFRASFRVDVMDMQITNTDFVSLSYSGQLERIYNNIFYNNGVSNGHGVEYMPKNYYTTIRDCLLYEAKATLLDSDHVEYIDCVFDYNNKANAYNENDISGKHLVLRNCTIKNYTNSKSWFGGGTFIDCIFENISVIVRNNLTFKGGSFTNCKFTSWTDPAHIKVDKVLSDDISYIKLDTNGGSDTIEIKDSNVTFIER